MTVAHTSLAMNVRKKYTHILQRKNNCVWLSVIPVIRNFFSFKVISCSLPGGETICAHPLLCRCNDFCSLELTFLLPPQAHSHIHTHTPPHRQTQPSTASARIASVFAFAYHFLPVVVAGNKTDMEKLLLLLLLFFITLRVLPYGR